MRYWFYFVSGPQRVVARFRAADFPLVALPVGFRLPRVVGRPEMRVPQQTPQKLKRAGRWNKLLS